MPPLRRLLALVTALAVLLFWTTAALGGTAADAVPDIPAHAYLLMNAASGQVMLEHEGETQLPMASTTKIMTAILALEQGNLNDVVTVGEKPYSTGGSTIWLGLGEQQTLQNLLYALMLESANDAAVAIAEHIGGTEERFVELMNQKAQAIGATHTHFANSHGLHDPNHYTTAHDLALIARYAMQNPEFRRLVETETATIPGFKANPPRNLVNHNQLLGYYDGTTGVKNGYTEEAGLTNVAAAKRGDTELIAVVLGAQNFIWTSSMKLLDYGFSHPLPAPVVQTTEAAAPATAPTAVAAAPSEPERAPSHGWIWIAAGTAAAAAAALVGRRKRSA
jgi:D-alanyl-D-alanine carboxypeptidase (penicillin-binding protein 5/6)